MNSVFEDLKTQVEVRLPPLYILSPVPQNHSKPMSFNQTGSLEHSFSQLQIQPTFENDKEKTFYVLHKMLTCGFVDIRKEALIAILQMVQYDNQLAQDVVNNQELKTIVLNFAQDEDDEEMHEIANCIVSALVNKKLM